MVITKASIIVVISLFLSSCGILFTTGHNDENNQWVPKRPRFKLKDKPGNILPKGLDTINVYKLSTLYSRNHQEYPVLIDSYKYNDPRYDNGIRYTKFYSNGRCLSFAIPSKDTFGNLNKLKNTDMNPNNPYYGKEYWYSVDGINIKIESFVYGEGDGIYIRSDSKLNASGDTLELRIQTERRIYIKEILPKNWIRYGANW